MPRGRKRKQLINQHVDIKPFRKSSRTNVNRQPVLMVAGSDLSIKHLFTGNGIRDNCK